MSDTAIEALRYSEFPNSSDCISRQAAIDALESYGEFIAISIIKALPTVQPEPEEIARHIATILENEQDMRVILKNAQPQRMRGRWENGRCNQCGEHALYWAMSSGYCASKFCPNCGAQMDGGEQE